jgi:signal transduction histidine kinase/ActR/RegA family two-component response regulator
MTDRNSFLDSQSKLLVAFFLFLAVLGGVTWWSIRDEKLSAIRAMDQEMIAVSRSIPYVLSPEYDIQMFHPLQMATEQVDEHVAVLTRYAQETRVDDFLLLVLKEDRLHVTGFTSGFMNLTEERPYRYFEPYEASMPAVVDALTSEQPVSFEHNDSYSVAVPLWNEDGDSYVVVASQDVEGLQRVLHRVWVSHFSNALIIFLGSLPIFYLFLKREESNQEGRYQLETHAWNAQRMETMGRIAGGVAHDFNNMVGVMMGAADVATLKLKKNLSVEPELQQIQLAANRSADIIRQLLTFAMEQSSAPELLDLNKSIDQSMKMVSRLLGADVRVIWQPDPDLYAVVLDPTHLDQILINLCANARDALEDDGVILIATENRVLDHEDVSEGLEPMPPGSYACLKVSDSGSGIDPEVLPNIFDPFYSTKEGSNASGLGLASVYGLVKQNQGYIRIQTQVGHGTDVYIYFPGEPDETVAEDVPGYEVVPLGKGETILLVEDHDLMLDLSERLLTGLDYRVLACSDPAEAISRAAAHEGTIDLLVTDMVMPGMNGRDLSEALSEKYPGLKTLFISGYNVEDLREKGIETGEVAFVTKPYTRRDLGVALRRVLSPEQN